MKKFIDNIRSKPAGGILLLFCTIQVVAIIAGLLYPENFRYLNPANIAVLLKSMSALGIMAIGVGILMISGEFDLSVGTLYTFCAIVTATMVKEYALSPYLAMIIGIIVGIIAGLIHGNIVNRFTIPSFIVTLGAMLLWKGGTLLYHGAKSLRYKYESETYKTVLTGDIGVIDASFLWFIGVGIVFYFIVHHHKIGNHFFAVGGNPEAARLSGVPVKWVLVFVYTLTGLLAGLGGVMEASLHITGDPKSGDLVELKVIAAVVVGGTSLAGGQGRILGTLIGAFIIAVINNGMNLTGVESHMQKVIYGSVILVAVLIDQLKIHLMKLKKY